jgi:heme A synthase
LYRYACATVAVPIGLLLAGGLVHGTGSGLACPDWPTCHGSLLPPMVGGVAIEHSHRLIATGVGLLTIGLAVALWRRGRRALGVAAVALVVLQGVLGGLTVLYQLPDFVSTAHLATAMLFFSLLIYIAYSVRPEARGKGEHPSAGTGPGRARFWAGLATVAVYLQAVLGALVRHTASGLACIPDLALCRGALWPDLGPARLHMAHRLNALLVAALVIAACVAARRSLRWLPRLLPGLVLLQIGFGVLSVWSGLQLVPVQLHLGAGALLLAGCVAMYLHLGRATVRADSPGRSAALRALPSGEARRSPPEPSAETAKGLA